MISDFQLAYRWRLDNNKYIYITDSIDSNGYGVVTGIYGGAPFIGSVDGLSIYDKTTNTYSFGITVSYFNENGDLINDKSVKLDISPEDFEKNISEYSKEKFYTADIYSNSFTIMNNLMHTDENGKKLTLLSYDNYYNIDSGETCSTGYDTVDCDKFDLGFDGTAYAIPYGNDPVFKVSGPVDIEQYNKTFKTYQFTFGLPQGPKGDKGTFEDINPYYMNVDGSVYFPLLKNDTNPYVPFNKENNVGFGIRYNSDESGDTSYTITATSEDPIDDFGYYISVNDKVYYPSDYVFSIKNQYIQMTFENENVIEGNNGDFYQTIYINVLDNDFLNGITNSLTLEGVDNGFVMAFKWGDKTKKPYYKNQDTTFIFNKCKFVIYRYKKTNTDDESGDTKTITLVVDNNVNFIVDGDAVFNKNVYLNDTLYAKDIKNDSIETKEIKVYSNDEYDNITTTIHGNEIIISDGDVSGETTTKITNESITFEGSDEETTVIKSSGIDTNKIESKEIVSVDEDESGNTTTITGGEIISTCVDESGNTTTTTITGGEINCKTLKSEIAYETSDIRRKNILEEKANFDISKILDLSIIYFNYKDDPDKKTRLGVIAQEIKEICPEIVWEDENGFLQVEYNKLALFSLYCIKDIYKKIQ